MTFSAFKNKKIFGFNYSVKDNSIFGDKKNLVIGCPGSGFRSFCIGSIVKNIEEGSRIVYVGGNYLDFFCLMETVNDIVDCNDVSSTIINESFVEKMDFQTKVSYVGFNNLEKCSDNVIDGYDEIFKKIKSFLSDLGVSEKFVFVFDGLPLDVHGLESFISLLNIIHARSNDKSLIVTNDFFLVKELDLSSYSFNVFCVEDAKYSGLADYISVNLAGDLSDSKIHSLPALHFFNVSKDSFYKYHL